MIVIDMVYFICVRFLKHDLYSSKSQNQMCHWNLKCFCFDLQKSYIKPSTWLTDLIKRFLYIIGCSGPRCGIAARVLASMHSGGAILWWFQQPFYVLSFYVIVYLDMIGNKKSHLASVTFQVLAWPWDESAISMGHVWCWNPKCANCKS